MCKKLATGPVLQRSHLDKTKIVKEISCGHNGKEGRNTEKSLDKERN
jgi:hypothetical protein